MGVLMKIALAVLAFLLAVMGWLKPENTPRAMTIAAIAILAVMLALQVGVEIRESREAAKSVYSGFLKPKSRTLFSPRQDTRPKLEFGDSGAILVWDGPHGQPMFRLFQDNELTIKMEEGQVKVSTLIRDRSGKVVADLVDNEWKVNLHNSFDRNYSRDALEVKDSSGDIVLQVKVLEDRIQFQGKFYGPDGTGIAFGKVCGPDGSFGGGIEITGAMHPELTMKFSPLFRYPSDQHLGEFVRDR